VERRHAAGRFVGGSVRLRSLAVMTTAWLLVSVVAGPVFGLLGQITRTMPVPGRRWPPVSRADCCPARAGRRSPRHHPGS
jgi:hypothetical protein